VIDDGETGFLVSPGDIVMLRDRISYMSIYEGKREIMGKRAREKAENNYRSKVVASKIERCLSKSAKLTSSF
jgi:glycosyltransferase involved in cell wall biosynthesis